MKSKFKTLFPILLLCTMVISLVPAAATTPEATVCLPAKLSGGVIIGNYNGEKKPIFNLEVHEKGVPRLYINATDAAGNLVNYDIQFSKVNIATGTPLHLAITIDTAVGTWNCYVNGELKQTITKATPKITEMTESLRLGGDFRSGNTQYFKGYIQSLALYSDMRTAQEIANDTAGVIVYFFIQRKKTA